MKKIIIIVLTSTLLLLGTIIPGTSFAVDKDFPDSRGHWAEQYILALTEMGGINGMTDGNFHPNEEVTFPQYVKIIIGCEYGVIAPDDGGDWASGYMKKALEIGIIDHWDMENTGPITRYDAARVVVSSLLRIYGEEEETDTSPVEVFEDYPSCKTCRSSFHETVGQCYVKGIITGKPGPVYDGEASLTRAEACIIIMKMIDPTLRTPIVVV